MFRYFGLFHLISYGLIIGGLTLGTFSIVKVIKQNSMENKSLNTKELEKCASVKKGGKKEILDCIKK